VFPHIKEKNAPKYKRGGAAFKSAQSQLRNREEYFDKSARGGDFFGGGIRLRLGKKDRFSRMYRDLRKRKSAMTDRFIRREWETVGEKG